MTLTGAVMTMCSWAGVMLALLGYMNLSWANEDARRPGHVLNLVAGVLLSIYCTYTQAWALLLLNLAWAAIALVTLAEEK